MAIGRIHAVAALALLVALPSCKSEAPAPPPPRLEVYGTDIGAGWANVSVRRDGAPVAGAHVVVNGVVLAASQLEAGLYSGQLAAMLEPGDPVSLEVTSDGLRVTGTGAFPDPPIIEAAYTSATDASGDIIVTWTSPSNPDSFEVSATWSCGPGCGAGRSFTAAGSARTLIIPAGSLPPGLDVDIAVFAYDDGSLAGDYLPWAAYPGMNIRAESGSRPVATGRTTPPPPTIQVRGQDINAWAANVIVTRNEVAIDDAVVVVNGQLIPRWPGVHGVYGARLETSLWPGDAVVLDVTSGGLHVRGLGNLPDAPVLTSPLSGAVIRPGHDVIVTWTSAMDPDSFDVVANWSCGPSCMTGTQFEAAGQARTLTIPAGAIQVLGPVGLQVFAYEDGALSGDYSPYLPYPGMNIRAESSSVTVEFTAN